MALGGIQVFNHIVAISVLKLNKYFDHRRLVHLCLPLIYRLQSLAHLICIFSFATWWNIWWLMCERFIPIAFLWITLHSSYMTPVCILSLQLVDACKRMSFIMGFHSEKWEEASFITALVMAPSSIEIVSKLFEYNQTTRISNLAGILLSGISTHLWSKPIVETKQSCTTSCTNSRIWGK